MFNSPNVSNTAKNDLIAEDTEKLLFKKEVDMEKSSFMPSSVDEVGDVPETSPQLHTFPTYIHSLTIRTLKDKYEKHNPYCNFEPTLAGQLSQIGIENQSTNQS